MRLKLSNSGETLLPRLSGAFQLSIGLIALLIITPIRFAEADGPRASTGLSSHLQSGAPKKKAPQTKNKEKVSVGMGFAAELEADLALESIDRDQYDEAARRAQQALIFYPNEATAHAVLAYVHAEKDEFNLSEAEAKKALKLRPTLSYAHAALALCLARQQKLDEAKAEFELAINAFPEDAMAYNDYGNILPANSAEAEAMYLKAIQINPLIPETHQALGRIYLAAKKFHEADNQFATANALNSKVERWHNDFGNALFGEGQYAAAADQYKAAISLHDPSLRTDKTFLETLFMNLLGADRRGKLYTDAESVASAALGVFPTSGQIMNMLGCVYLDQEKWSDAALQLEGARSTMAIDATYACNLAAAYYHLKRYSDSESMCQVALTFSGEPSTAHNLLGLVAMDQKQYSRAEAEFSEAVREVPKEAAFHANLGSAEVELKRYDAAEAECLKAIELDTQSATAFNALGNIYADKLQWNSAMTHYRVAIIMNPRRGVFHANLASALLRLGRTDDAKAEARKALDLGWTDHWVYKELGMN